MFKIFFYLEISVFHSVIAAWNAPIFQNVLNVSC